MIRTINARLPVSVRLVVLTRSPISKCFIRHQAFDASFDSDDLNQARKWRTAFSESHLPDGQTSFSRSSGPGGQHVNKTETKATTVWSIHDLQKTLPKLLHTKLRASRYYTSRTDSMTIQAQTQRSRSANASENKQKLAHELLRIYQETVPGASSPEKTKKYEALEKAAEASRLRLKKQHSNKKASRKRSFDD